MKKLYEWMNDLRMGHPFWSSIGYSFIVVFAPLLMSCEARELFLGKEFSGTHSLKIVVGALVVLVLTTAIHELLIHYSDKCSKSYKNDLARVREKLTAVEKVVPSAIYGILESLKNELRLTSHERISLYLVETTDDGTKYFCCERCSPDLSLERKSCKLRPLEKMFKTIWDKGYLYDDKFPDCTASKRKMGEYIKYCKDTYEVPGKEVKDISFKGRTYYGVRIDYRGDHLAFMVLTSLDVGIAGKSESEVSTIVGPSCAKLGAVIQALREYVPSPAKVVDNKEF